MPPRSMSNEARISALEDRVAELVRRLGRPDENRRPPSRPPVVRLAIAKPTDGGMYPAAGTVFPIRFIDSLYVEVDGDQPLNKYDRSQQSFALCYTLGDLPARNSVVPVVRFDGQWYTWGTGMLAVVWFTLTATLTNTSSTGSGSITRIMGKVPDSLGATITMANPLGSVFSRLFAGDAGRVGYAFWTAQEGYVIGNLECNPVGAGAAGLPAVVIPDSVIVLMPAGPPAQQYLEV